MITYDEDKHAAWIKARYEAIDKAEQAESEMNGFKRALAQTRPGEVASVPKSIVPKSMDEWMSEHDRLLTELSELEKEAWTK